MSGRSSIGLAGEINSLIPSPRERGFNAKAVTIPGLKP